MAQFIELTKANGGGKCQLPVQSMDGFEAKERGGTIIRMKDAFCDVGSRYVGPEIHVIESPAAIRSALLKAGLLVVVEEDAKPYSANDDRSKMSIRDLLNSYVFWASELADCQCESVIAELQRRIESKPEQVVRLQLKSNERGWCVACGGAELVSDRPFKNDAIGSAIYFVRAINPSARIECENEI